MGGAPFDSLHGVLALNSIRKKRPSAIDGTQLEVQSATDNPAHWLLLWQLELCGCWLDITTVSFPQLPDS